MPGGVIVVCALAVFGIVGLVVAATKLEPSLPKSSSKKKRSSTTPETPAPSIFATTISKVAQRFGAEDPLRRHQEPARSHEHPTPPSQRTTADEAALAVESTHATGPQSTPTPSNLQSVPLIQFESDSDHSSTPLATPTVLEQFDPYYGAPLSPLGSPIASKPLGRDAGNPHPTAPRSQYPLLEVPQGRAADPHHIRLQMILLTGLPSNHHYLQIPFTAPAAASYSPRHLSATVSVSMKPRRGWLRVV
ncbi:SubName: Full=Uncharacterized protein {ECO:0000313/EMBL:CCA74799.1} [Serendipita indica DSM 11827]|nr:SubName: Full=Uncharacterized protein {ECO:0000313/EMBL:CCA74799.1} [Serendipita indica DSM 11827]